MSMTPVQQIPVTTISGETTSLGAFAGDVLLVVNVASKCGLTPQYEGLEALYAANRDRGFQVVGFPANNFGGQEPGTEEEIAEFCSLNYAVSFPMMAKISVAGDDRHPLYGELIRAQPEATGETDAMRANLRRYNIPATEAPDVVWNFEKFVIARDGTVAGRFAPSTVPDDPGLVAAIEEQLAEARP
jgi:glutathione peroxidase